MKLDKLYSKSPVWLQNLGVSLYGYKWQRRRFGGIFNTESALFKNREQYSLQQWEDYQLAALRKLLLHSFETVPFYNKKYTDAGFDIHRLRNFELGDLQYLPCLEKAELRNFGSSTLLSSKREQGGEFHSSSGSTGTPVQILFSYGMHQRLSAAVETRIKNWAGLSRFDARGMIGGRRVVNDGVSGGPFYRYNLFEKQVYFSAYHIAASNAGDYLNGIKKYDLQYMTGYAMSNFFLARFIEEMNLKAPPLKAVITSSEKLTPEMRETFKRVYQCKTFDSYSGVEACGLISECEFGGLHISPDVGIFEIIKEDGSPCKPGEEGEVVSTGFLNYDQPLIRYRIGDMVKLSTQQNCSCGRKMPLVDEIVGRIEDTVIGKDGRELVRFHGIFINLNSIVEGQIIQHTLDDFEIKVVLTNELTRQQKDIITKRMFSQLGEVKLAIHEVPFIARNQNGKFKAVISNVKRNK
jgi:phenylacetate-CoA ligase